MGRQNRVEMNLFNMALQFVTGIFTRVELSKLSF
jgi:hypothetical protein